MKIVKGGAVRKNDQPAKLSTAVNQIQFDGVAPNVTVPVGAIGTMTLVDPPPQIGRYDVGNELCYSDSNHNNDATLCVKTGIGPSKYTVERTA